MPEIIKYVDQDLAELVRRNGHHNLLVTERGDSKQPEPLILVHGLSEKDQLEWARYMFIHHPGNPSWWAFEMLENKEQDYKLGLAVIVINPVHMMVTSADISPRTRDTRLGIPAKWGLEQSHSLQRFFVAPNHTLILNATGDTNIRLKWIPPGR